MKFRMFAIIVFIMAMLFFAVTLFLNWQRNRAVPDPEFVAATTVVTDENFDDVLLGSEKPVVVDFYGDYCEVCRKLEPKLLTLAKEYSDAAVFARVNVQDAPELIQRYEVRQVPTLVVIHQGELVFRGAGLSALPPMKAVLEATKKGKLPSIKKQPPAVRPGKRFRRPGCEQLPPAWRRFWCSAIRQPL